MSQPAAAAPSGVNVGRARGLTVTILATAAIAGLVALLMPSLHMGGAHPGADSSGAPERYILSGSFRTPNLHLLSYDPGSRTLRHRKTIPALGPHQYLGLNRRRDRVYATSWALPPRLSAWAVTGSEQPTVELVGDVPITATSSYTFATEDAVYSAGGPTGEVHLIDRRTGGFGEKLQELAYVPEDRLEREDKTRAALRNGSHAIEISSRGHAFVPHLGHNSIWMYSVDPSSHRLTLLDEVKSPREGDGPRHVVVSADGNVLCSVTEHTQYVDVYRVEPTTLVHVSSHSLLPAGADPHLYRGDTLRLSPTSPSLLATTRGGSAGTRGVVAAWAIDPSTGFPRTDREPARWTTPTSGGKANAIEFAPRWGGKEGGGGGGGDGRGEEELVVLTDDEEGWVFVLSWDGRALAEVARASLGDGEGASHAVWLI